MARTSQYVVVADHQPQMSSLQPCVDQGQTSGSVLIPPISVPTAAVHVDLGLRVSVGEQIRPSSSGVLDSHPPPSDAVGADLNGPDRCPLPMDDHLQVANRPVLDDPSALRVFAGSTFFRTVMNDICSMVVGFLPILQIFLFNLMRSLALMKII